MRIGFLASHNGSGMRAILRAIAAGEIDATPAIVISNNEGAPALDVARSAGIQAEALNARLCGSPAAADTAIARALQRRGADLIVLSGFLRPLGTETLERYRNRVLNVHPALLPKFGGKGMYGRRVHQAVLAAGENESGATIHLVDAEYDHGPVIAQRAIELAPDETPETLAARVQDIEAGLLVAVVRDLAQGRIDLDAIAAATAAGMAAASASVVDGRRGSA